MKLYDISGEQFSAMDAPRHLMTQEGTAQTTLDRSLGICQVAELEGKVTREVLEEVMDCLLYTSPSPRDRTRSRMPSSA